MRLLIILTILGAVLRFGLIDSLPPANRDELAIGYNAYALAQTGHDEHGVSYPTSFQSFGDYKLPGLIYLVAGLLKFLPLKEWVVRLPNATVGTLLIPLTYLLTHQLFGKKKLSLLAAGITTVSFWHIHASRSAYEPLIGLFFTTATITAYIAARKNPFLYIISILSSALAFVTYNTPPILIPLMEIIILKNYWSHHTHKQAAIAAILVTLLLSFSIVSSTSAVAQSRSATTIIGDPATAATVNRWVYDIHKVGVPLFVARIFANKATIVILDTAKGYMAAFNPAYVFFTGDQNPWHNLRSIHLGNLNPLLLPPVFYGIWYLLTHRHQHAEKTLASLIAVAPLASAITIDAPITNRLLEFHFLLEITAAYGLYQAWPQLSQQIQRLFSLCFIGITIFFTSMYAIVYPHQLLPLWNPGATPLFKSLSTIKDEYQGIYITEELSHAYIYAAFYTPFSPADFMHNAVWNTNGFRVATQYRQYHFTSFPHYKNWTIAFTKSTFTNANTRLLIIHNPIQPINPTPPQLSISGAYPQPIWIGEAITPQVAQEYFAAHPEENPYQKEIVAYLNSI